MASSLEITSDVRLVLITGSPGAGKTSVAKALFCEQSEEWRMLSLDDFFYLKVSAGSAGDAWDNFEASAPIRAAVIRYVGAHRGRVIAEGIIQSDAEVGTYCKAMDLTPTSPRFRFFDLRSSREEGGKRMFNRPVKEEAQAGWTFELYERHFEWLTGKLRARGAARIETDGKSPRTVARELVDIINRVD